MSADPTFPKIREIWATQKIPTQGQKTALNGAPAHISAVVNIGVLRLWRPAIRDAFAQDDTVWLMRRADQANIPR